ncbi:hypothetical protein FXO37_35631 [Capsicum annuum]|nr:hypothetical protein FXO37_35631 [Capsicum annuum]
MRILLIFLAHVDDCAIETSLKYDSCYMESEHTSFNSSFWIDLSLFKYSILFRDVEVTPIKIHSGLDHDNEIALLDLYTLYDNPLWCNNIPPNGGNLFLEDKSILSAKEYDEIEVTLKKLGSHLLVLKGDPGEAGQPSCASTPLSTAISSLSPIGNTGSFAVSGVPTCIRDIQKSVIKHTSPPVSLLGKLLWHGFFYTVAFRTPDFDQMKESIRQERPNILNQVTCSGKCSIVTLLQIRAQLAACSVPLVGDSMYMPAAIA